MCGGERGFLDVASFYFLFKKCIFGLKNLIFKKKYTINVSFSVYLKMNIIANLCLMNHYYSPLELFYTFYLPAVVTKKFVLQNSICQHAKHINYHINSYLDICVILNISHTFIVKKISSVVVNGKVNKKLILFIY